VKRRTRVAVLAAGGCAVFILLACAGAGTAVFMLFAGTAGSPDSGAAVCGYGAPAPDGASASPVLAQPSSTGGAGGVTVPHADGRGEWDADQTGIAATLVAVGRDMEVAPRGWVIAVAAAMQESRLHNLAGGDRDSIGILQQRPSMNWGTPDQLRNPEYQAREFYKRLVALDRWESLRLTDAAQAVQRSAYPELYQQWEADAQRVVAAVSGIASVDILGGGFPGAPCGIDMLSVSVSDGTWIRPVDARVGSPFRGPGRPHHDGVDFEASRFTPIRAASDGTVVTVVCNSGTGDCDRDGSVGVSGCGWYVEVLHTGDVVTRYCHMVRRPAVSEGDRVRGGQVLGLVGSSGNSSGPHLHFEVHQGSPATGANAVDPVAFMARRGAPLVLSPA
jgi:murein DD-endopeptidase MepM/ murein hydrolase activator NlpD